MDARFTDQERERLEQELLELHFGCHPEPEALQARLDREPALRELQQRVLRTADVLLVAATPQQAPLPLSMDALSTDALSTEHLPTPMPRGPRLRSWQRPWARIASVAAAAALVVASVGAFHGLRCLQENSARVAQCHLTVSAPQAVPAGAPWSFTAESFDLDGAPKATTLQWHATAQ